jgi:uncharacterized protein (TIGR03437 family)
MRFSKMILPVLLLVSAALGVGNAQTISIVSGNGQVASQLSFSLNPKTSFDPMVVKVTDALGRPLSGATVNWSITSGAGSVEASQTYTDAEGLSSNRYFSNISFINLTGAAYEQSVITAATAASAVTFTETQELTNQQQPGSAQVVVTYPTGYSISGQAGSVSTLPFLVQVTSLLGYPVQGVAVKLETDDDQTLNPPTVVCQSQPGQAPGVVLTDTSGSANCLLQFGPRIGSDATFKVNVGGGWRVSSVYTYAVTVGPPASILILRGNNQAATVSGTNLPAPLVAQVSDLGGNPVGDTPVTWSVIPAEAATLFNTRQSSAVDGQVSANVKIANATGSFQVRVALAANQAIGANFTVTAPQVTISGLNKSSGDNQDAGQNTAFSNPIAVQAIANGAPIGGVPISFVVTSGSATLSASGATTNSQGIAQVNVTAGPTVGAVVVTASAGGYSVTFNLTVRPPGPAFTSDSFYNGLSYLKASDSQGGISPCSIATVVAGGLAPGVTGVIAPAFWGPLPYQINKTTVTFNDRPAPIYSVINQSGQESITVQVPCEIQAGTANVTINVQGGSKTGTATVRSLSPGILETTDSDNKVRAVLVRADGSFVNPTTNPARRGDILRAYATGLGQTQPNLTTNAVPIPGVDVVSSANVIVGVNNAGARVVSVKAAANLVGLFEITFEVPQDTPAQEVNFSVAVVPPTGGGTVYSKGSRMVVQ